MKQPCYQACARKTDKVIFTTRSDPIVFAIVFNAEEQRTQRFFTTVGANDKLESRVGVGS